MMESGWQSGPPDRYGLWLVVRADTKEVVGLVRVLTGPCGGRRHPHWVDPELGARVRGRPHWSEDWCCRKLSAAWLDRMESVPRAAVVLEGAMRRVLDLATAETRACNGYSCAIAVVARRALAAVGDDGEGGT